MKRIGLTGGIGCGKSTVLECFRDLGIDTIDTDELAREVVAPGTLGLKRVITEFGPNLLKADGQLDREALAKSVFQDASARRKLESIIHPRIARAILWRYAKLWLQLAAVVVVEVPLLFEKAMERRFDETVCVIADEEAVFRRLEARNGWSRDQVRARLASQLPLTEKERRADHVIDNGGDMGKTRRRVEELVRLWRPAS